MGIADFQNESLSHDPIHGYIAFSSAAHKGETSEADLIDHPWLQRLRHIHQLQSAWWVFPSAEHTRFQHVLGAMHLAGHTVDRLYASLAEACTDVPSRAYVVALARLAGLLHDVGHGPMGHFFDDQFLAQYDLNHEVLGQTIITCELGKLVAGIRRSPYGELASDERMDPARVAFLIRRPQPGDTAGVPAWLAMLRGLWCGTYTVDNMDFVMRDSYMTGYRLQAFDLERIIRYSFFTASGLTIHKRGLPALLSFLKMRSELFMAVYFHRTVRALDLAMEEIFGEILGELFPGNPKTHLRQYRDLTEWSLHQAMVDWARNGSAKRKKLGRQWQTILSRPVRWKLAHETTVRFDEGESSLASVFSDSASVAARIRDLLPARQRKLEFRVDVAKHHPRPINPWAVDTTSNFVYDPGSERVEPLAAQDEFRRLPTSEFLCRLYCLDRRHIPALADALGKLLTPGGDDKTNV
jgi:uncharacterized protein